MRSRKWLLAEFAFNNHAAGEHILTHGGGFLDERESGTLRQGSTAGQPVRIDSWSQPPCLDIS
jgi:hypothetical protein|eukprot:COSAG01_NODE_2301_length_7953_cov_4.000127_5_plen_63_part_00